MTIDNYCKCTDKEHDHSKPCTHGGVTGKEADWNNWVCNWCDYVNGTIDKSVIEAHAHFVMRLEKMGKRTLQKESTDSTVTMLSLFIVINTLLY